MLSAKRDTKAAKRFFRKMLKAPKHQSPRVINVDQNKAYPPAVEELKQEGMLIDITCAHGGVEWVMPRDARSESC